MFATSDDRDGGFITADEDYVGEAVIDYPDDMKLPETDVDNEDVGFSVIVGPHTAEEWRLDNGMLVCPCEVCPTCNGMADARERLPGCDQAYRRRTAASSSSARAGG